MLKCDLHLHTNVDPIDVNITHSPYDLIDHAAKLGFQVLSLTHHLKVIFDKKWAVYAKKKNILLIPGTEARIEGRDVLLYNFTAKEVEKLKCLDDLAKYAKRKDRLMIAPHPFYPIPSGRHVTHSVGISMSRACKYMHAIEYCHFYLSWFNVFNVLAGRASVKYGLPLFANSDAHALWFMGSNYTLVDAKKSILSIFAAIKKGKIEIATRPRTIRESARLMNELFSPHALRKLVFS